MDHDTEYSSHRLLDAVQTLSNMGEDMKDVPGVGDQLMTAKDALKKALATILSTFTTRDKADQFKDYDTETRREFAKKGWALPDGSYPIADKKDLTDAVHRLGSGSAPKAQIKNHIIKRAKALGATDLLPADWAGSTKEETSDITLEVDSMADKPQTQPTSTPPAPPAPLVKAEAFSVTAEEFKVLREKAQKADVLETQVNDLKTRSETFATQLAEERHARQLDLMIKHVDQFVALAVKPDELGGKLLELKELKPELFEYFDKLLQAADKAMVQADLFTQHASGRAEETADTLEAAVEAELKENFKNDRSKYIEAMNAVQVKRPDLAKAYQLRTQR